jgi:hypothetical protein
VHAEAAPNSVDGDDRPGTPGGQQFAELVDNDQQVREGLELEVGLAPDRVGRRSGWLPADAKPGLEGHQARLALKGNETPS